MTFGNNNKMQQLLNYTVKVVLRDSRIYIGTFRAFDKHMNVILGDCDEFRKIKSKVTKITERDEQRGLGFVLFRGETIVSLTIEGLPPPEEGLPRVPLPGAVGGPGGGRASGRGSGMGGAPRLQGPARGLSGAPQQFMPSGSREQLNAPPQMRGGSMMAPPPGMMGQGMGRAGQSGRGFGMRHY